MIAMKGKKNISIVQQFGFHITCMSCGREGRYISATTAGRRVLLHWDWGDEDGRDINILCFNNLILFGFYLSLRIYRRWDIELVPNLLSRATARFWRRFDLRASYEWRQLFACLTITCTSPTLANYNISTTQINNNIHPWHVLQLQPAGTVICPGYNWSGRGSGSTPPSHISSPQWSGTRSSVPYLTASEVKRPFLPSVFFSISIGGKVERNSSPEHD